MLSVPNLLTMARIPLAFGAAFTLESCPHASMAMVLGACLTDFLDGLVARKTGAVSDTGRLLDPLADKIAFVVFSLAVLAEGGIPLWVPLVLVCREGLVVAGGLALVVRAGGSRVPESNLAGKASTLMLAVYLVRQAYWPGGVVLAGLDWIGLVAMFSLLLSTFVYASRLMGRSRQRGDSPGTGDGNCT
ncbi:CDP-alcohol phosphatidyltransferase family protein [Candidatus Fermentibacterales bacterium]|nr:CDP-alcohol phosphatidyltransferase family protein [Candidatus Fermentibacterales bacterium]